MSESIIKPSKKLKIKRVDVSEIKSKEQLKKVLGLGSICACAN